jgi:hypothetical protein
VTVPAPRFQFAARASKGKRFCHATADCDWMLQTCNTVQEFLFQTLTATLYAAMQFVSTA